MTHKKWDVSGWSDDHPDLYILSIKTTRKPCLLSPKISYVSLAQVDTVSKVEVVLITQDDDSNYLCVKYAGT